MFLKSLCQPARWIATHWLNLVGKVSMSSHWHGRSMEGCTLKNCSRLCGSLQPWGLPREFKKSMCFNTKSAHNSCAWEAAHVWVHYPVMGHPPFSMSDAFHLVQERGGVGVVMGHHLFNPWWPKERAWFYFWPDLLQSFLEAEERWQTVWNILSWRLSRD